MVGSTAQARAAVSLRCTPRLARFARVSGLLAISVALFLACPGAALAANPGTNAPTVSAKKQKRYTITIDPTTRKRIRYHQLEAPELGKRFRYMVYLPKGGIKPGKKYPLLVLLHGLGEYPHGWITLGGIHKLVDELVATKKMPAPILLLASGRNGYWTNWADGRHPYGDLVVRRYLDDIRRRYPIADRAEQVGIAGCSMGGFGALSLGLQYPEHFGFVVALSPTDMEIALELSPRRRIYRSIVGPSHAEQLAVQRINPRHLVLRGYGSPRQRFLMIYGAREGRKFGEGTERVAHAMRLRGLQVEVMRVAREGHGWKNAWEKSHPWWVSALAEHWQRSDATAAPPPAHVNGHPVAAAPPVAPDVPVAPN